MLGRLKSLVLDPYPLRSASLRIARKFNLGDFNFRYRHGLFDRPHYAYILFEGAKLAKKLGHNRVSAIEFGVAGGNGLLAMERLAKEIERQVDIKYEIYGFDTGKGLPPPKDFRDLPYHWQEGFFAMDMPVLKRRLQCAHLVVGDIQESSETFFSEFRPAPIAAIAHDFDYYSSTMNALKMFDGPDEYFLPRVFCYFDDIIGGPLELYNDYTGQRGAIHDFNSSHSNRKLCPVSYLTTNPIKSQWHHQIYSYHYYGHPDYCKFVSADDQHLPL
jgi:hypothetical protein